MLENVTIGIPVFNEEQYIAKALDSAIVQNCRVIVADNASTDGTEAICREYASKHRQVSYIKHPSNMGCLANFAYCLDNAQTNFFMWLGGHDFLPADFCKILMKVLEKNEDAVMAYAPVVYIDQKGEHVRKHCFDELQSGASSIRADDRVLTLMRDLIDYTLVHGIYVTKVLHNVMCRVSMAAPDVVMLARAASHGRLICDVGTTYYRRLVRDNDSKDAYMKRISGARDAPPYTWRLTSEELLKVVLHIVGPGMFGRFLLARECARIMAMPPRVPLRFKDMGAVLHYILRGSSGDAY